VHGQQVLGHRNAPRPGGHLPPCPTTNDPRPNRQAGPENPVQAPASLPAKISQRPDARNVRRQTRSAGWWCGRDVAAGDPRFTAPESRVQAGAVTVHGDHDGELSTRSLIGTHEGHWCQEAWRIRPGGLRSVSGLGLTVLQDLPRSCLVYVAVREGSSWSARSRAAARTNELDADERRTIMDSEEGVLSDWL